MLTFAPLRPSRWVSVQRLPLLLALGFAPASAAVAAVTLEDIVPQSGAAQAGLIEGDVVLSWRLEPSSTEPSSTAPSVATEGEPLDIFDLWDLDGEQRHLGKVELTVRRNGDRLRLAMPQGTAWQLRGFPELAPAELNLYLRGRGLARSGKVAEAVEVWTLLEEELVDSGQERLACWAAGIRARLFRDQAGGWLAERQALEAALAHARKSGDSDVVAAAAYILGQAAEKAGDFAAAKEFFEESIRARELNPQKPLRTSSAWSGLGNLTLRTGDLELTADAYRRALALTTEFAPRSMLHAATLTSLAIVHSRRGEQERANTLNLEALAAAEAVDPRALTTAQILTNLGGAAIRQSDFRSARGYLERALRLKRTLNPGTLDFTGTLNNLGIVAWSLGRFAESERLLLEAQVIKEKLNPKSPEIALGLGNLANLARLRGDSETALELAHRGLELLAEVAPGSLELARIVGIRGQLLHELGRYNEALPDLERALEIRREQAPASLDVADSMRKLADFERDRLRPEKAELYIAEALALQQAKAPASLEVAATLDSWARIAELKGQLEQALSLNLRALTLRRELAPESFLVAESASAVGRLRRDAGLLGEALSSFEEAVAALESQEREVGGLELERYRFSARFASTYRDSIALLVTLGRSEEAFARLEQSRARTFRSLVAERRLDYADALPAELQAARNAAEAEYDRAFAALGEAGGVTAEELAGRRERLEAARRRQAEVKAQVRAAAPRVGALESSRTLTLSEAQRSLAPGTLALLYSLGEKESLLFALGPGRHELQVLKLAVSRSQAASMVRRWLTLLTNPTAAATLDAVSAQLSNQLLAPASALIGRAQRLIVVADGALHYLPFAALPDPSAPAGSSRPLVASLALSKVSSLTVLDDLRRRPRAGSAVSLLALGDPSLPAAGLLSTESQMALRSATVGGLELTALPSARREVENLGKIFSGTSELLLGEAATEEQVRKRASRKRLLHFATHGYVDEHQPLDSGLVLAQGASGERTENGYLQAWEILEQLELDADLVTLSACSTGLGQELEGEGILGLSRAFQHAGARAVMSSFWNVADDSTALLMERFYRAYRDGASQAEALRQAQRALAEGEAGTAFRHPYYWAAFELLGDAQ